MTTAPYDPPINGASMSPSASLAGQTALVTGGGRGIGRAIALALGEAGAEVVVNYSSPAAAAGFEVGDVITAVSGDAVKSSREVVRVMGRLEPEHEVSVAVVRAGAPLTLSATVGERETARFFTHLPQLPDFANLEYLEVLRDELPRIMVQIEEAEEAMRQAFEEARERMQDFDYGALADRLAEAEDRLRELERKLEEKER